ncbi:equilibrative nucleotide transporter 8 [Spinacia oleracea]|uniref:Equilibrative nucleotide transporter 8 n=1 Tax=Spinacia oleracea TaxID=3562 RepID=A0A9R0J0F5_SPIOL|nr:equilibrative nucleotide transporter 8 [Spinacia oleracea]
METMKNVQVQTSEAVRDTYKIAYILHFFLGAGNLLPWNAFITAIDYFAYLYPSKHVERVFSVAYMTSSLLVLLLMIKSQGSRSGSRFRLRMNVGFTMFVLSLMVTPAIDWVKWPSVKGNSDGSFIATVASVVVCGLADGLIGGSLIGSAGKLPKEYMQAVFAGTASSGVLVSMLRIITKASLPENPRGLQTSAHFYFIVSAIIVVVCTVCSNLLFRLPVMQEHQLSQQHIHNPITTNKPRLSDTAKKILHPTIGILSIYVVTLSIFPGFISDDNHTSELLKDWYPILIIMVYNFSDLAGKSLTALLIPNNITRVTWACLARVMFFPAFRASLHGPRWLQGEVFTVLLTFLLGISNGYLTSTLMILTPKSVSLLEAETAAVVMAVALGVGLVGGSVLGWLWVI